MAANPFDVLPPGLFNLLGTSGFSSLQRHYVAVLLRLYGLAEFNRFGLTREMVIAEIVDYLQVAGAEATEQVAADMAAQNGAAVDPPEEAGAEAEDGRRRLTGQKQEHEYAAYLLRRLAEAGWIEREQHADYSESITLPDYAFSLLEAFRTIQEQKPREFAGQLYTAHQLLAGSRSKDFSPALALTQAYENVRQVVRGLNELNHNIRRYIERATRGRDVAELLRLQFDDYTQTLGPAYHALKTSDHVSRYRRDIIGKLQSWQRSEDWLARAADELAAQGRLSPAQAAGEIGHAIQFIIAQLEALDPLLEEIDRRHAQYLRTSLRQVRYQLVSTGGNFKDRLVLLARELAALPAETAADLFEQLSGLPYTPVRVPDQNSFYTLPQRRAPFVTESVSAPALLAGELAALRAATLNDVSQAPTPARVNRYVLSFFNGHRRLGLAELPPAVLDDLHWLTTIIAYSHHPDVAYGLETVAGEPVPVGPYRVVPFELFKL
jgi:hypothetical protein